jgi:hypothetical protein
LGQKSYISISDFTVLGGWAKIPIMDYFGYQNWNSPLHKPLLMEQLEAIVKRDTTPTFILPEILSWLKLKQIIRTDLHFRA